MPLKKLDPKQQEAERMQAFIADLLREEKNKTCADCAAKQPRWASWNIGVFLCIRCAGLHRNLGVHLSKVKSVNLDSWTPLQVQSMRVMGNARAKEIYEHEIPDHFIRPSNDQALESFIRSKYEHKRYMIPNWKKPEVNVQDLPKTPQRQQANVGLVPPPPPPPTQAPVVVEKKKNTVKVPPPQEVLIDLNSDDSNGAQLMNFVEDLKSDLNCHSPEFDNSAYRNFFDLPAPAEPVSTEDIVAEVKFDEPLKLSKDLAGLSLDTGAQEKKKSNSDILALFGKNHMKPPTMQTSSSSSNLEGQGSSGTSNDSLGDFYSSSSFGAFVSAPPVPRGYFHGVQQSTLPTHDAVQFDSYL